MSTSCASIADTDQESWTYNTRAAKIATAFLAFTCIWYLYDIFTVGWNVYSSTKWRHMKPWSSKEMLERKKVWVLAVNALSGLLASAIGLVFIFATVALWPQPLEAAALMTVAFAQASVLGWQEQEPEGSFKELLDKLPDVFAVGVAATTLLYVLQGPDGYVTDSGNEFSRNHDPLKEVILSFTLAGFGCVIGILQEGFAVYKRKRINLESSSRQPDQTDDEKKGGNNKSNIVECLFSALFLFAQIATGIPTVYYGHSTLSEGCRVFNATKITAIVALCFGMLYSLVLTTFKWRQVWKKSKIEHYEVGNNGS